jgi:hypothetical protein
MRVSLRGSRTPTAALGFNRVSLVSRSAKNAELSMETAMFLGAKESWAAGSSRFPASGCVNSTLTIVAMSTRLASHLKAELGS